MTALLIFMFTVVIPQFAELYEQIGSQLPAMTLGLLTTGKWMQHNIVWILVTLAIIGVVSYRFAGTEKGRDAIDGFRIGLPIFGKIWLKYQVALFSRTTLSTLLDGWIAAGAFVENGGAFDFVAAGVAGGIQFD